MMSLDHGPCALRMLWPYIRKYFVCFDGGVCRVSLVRCSHGPGTSPAVPGIPSRPQPSPAILSQHVAVFTQIINAVLIIVSHLVPENAADDDSTSGGTTVASAAGHLYENDHLGTAEALNSVRGSEYNPQSVGVSARRRARQLE